MDKQQIISFMNELFEGVPMNDSVVREQKEELQNHLEERINDYMAEGYSFEDAFEASKNDLGDINELIQEFTKRSSAVPKRSKRKKLSILGRLAGAITALSPFIYILMGVFISGWRVWAIGWLIIPVSGILAHGLVKKDGMRMIPALSPFVYIALGFWLGGTFWAWGWVIIPISTILVFKSFDNIDFDFDFDFLWNNKYYYEKSPEDVFDKNFEFKYDRRQNPPAVYKTTQNGKTVTVAGEVYEVIEQLKEQKDEVIEQLKEQNNKIEGAFQ